MASFVILTIQYFILIYFELLDSGMGSLIQLSSKILVGIAFLYALPSVLKRSSIKILTIYSVCIFIFILHFAIFPENRIYMLRLVFPLFFMNIPAFIYALSINDIDILKKIMKKSSYVVFLFGFLIGVLAILDIKSVGVYSISLSYYMLLPTILFLDELIDKFSLKILLLILLSLIVIVSIGSRGALGCIAFFLILKLIKSNKRRTFKVALSQFFIISLVILVSLYLDKILVLLNEIFIKFDINSRTLYLLTQDEISLSGRDVIYETVMAEIVTKPILGIGLAGDTRIIGSGYVHNFFIEILGNYGMVLGLILNIIIIFLIVKALFIKDKKKYNMILIWLSIGFVHLMVSSSYLVDIKFWIFLGLLLKITFENKQVKYNV